MHVKVENGNLDITLPMQTPSPSSSGKTLIVATSGGTKETDVIVNGKNVTVGVNAYIKAK